MSEIIDEAGYLAAVVDAEKKLFTLKTLRDRLQNSYYENKNLKVENYGLEEPHEKIECKLQEVPEKPVFDKKSKMMLLSRKLFKVFRYVLAVTLLLLIVTLAITVFFTKPFSNAGILGYIFIISLVASFVLFVAPVGMAFYETMRFNEAYKEWDAVRAEIEEANEKEKNRVFGEEAVRKAKYQQDMEAINLQQEELSLIGNARAEVYELIKGKIVKNVYNAENNLAELYSYKGVPTDYRRIDIVMLLQEYISDEIATNIEEAIAYYDSQIDEGKVAKQMSDIYDEESNYTENMACFCNFVGEVLQQVDEVMTQTEIFVEGISSKAVNVALRSVKSGAIAMEFQRTYDESVVAQFANSIQE